ncbi:hypothetical protein EJ05DRAFT_528872 [Pseudovirgaria hyperparasitica]|uniref:Uncharacterized protein n=1 Tax=Pseudovirgaria hyperparasitica TaxID=470096 RepID=A0A6A6W6T5_9PEZI|nr:uncharacterized protein EJ05DRAFT_528872 [Pseudovirgaria hyperparasitica]KAF2757277.1 hypothetical protein EJ05DRAFT_528872 [Pseudovirgaria hyperparasitica]
MTAVQTLLAILTAIICVVLALYNDASSIPTTPIQWKPCSLNESATIPPEQQVSTQCGTITAPLDYTDPSRSTVDLRLVKIPSLSKPSQGSILFNFGGPGEPGYTYFAAYGQRLQAIAGQNHDLILVVPRGTVDGSLLFECYESTVARDSDALVRRILAGGATDVALGDIWANAAGFAKTCERHQNQTGRFIGSATTARDIMGVVDALDEDGMLRFWGFSYGTFVGSILAATYPDRIHRMVLDGVINGHEIQQGFDIEAPSDADKALSGFCSACVENKSECSAARDLTADELESQIYASIEEIRLDPMSFFIEGAGAFVLDYTNVKFFIYFYLYYSNTWPMLASLIDALVRKDREGLNTYVQSFVGNGGQAAISNAPIEHMIGIRCSDIVSPPTSDLANVRKFFEARMASSRIGGDLTLFINANCAQWPMADVVQYKGTFAAQTKNPILFVGNRADPITPMVSARNMSASFEGSVVMQHDSYGHTTLLSGASLCTAKTIQSYFLSGQLPEPGTVCPTDVSRFASDNGWDKVTQALTASAS